MSKLRLLLDENIGKRVVTALRESGYDVASVLEDAPGSTDTDVLKRARKEKRILVTLDKDFGALIFRDSESYVGVLFLRLQNRRHAPLLRQLLPSAAKPPFPASRHRREPIFSCFSLQ